MMSDDSLPPVVVPRTVAEEKAKGAKDRELLFEITQAVLAIIVVLGGGFILLTDPTNPNATFLGGAIGTVLALYFQKKVNGYPSNEG